MDFEYTSEQIQVLLRRLNQELGMTMLMVTHDNEVAKIGTRRRPSIRESI